MPKVSVIIPLFNIPIDIFEKCLKSCDGYDNIEVIVIDDGSKIDYKNLISKYNVKYIKTKNHGISTARNIGISMSKGEYITLLDSDDEIILNNNIIDNLKSNDIILTRSYMLKDELIPNNYRLNSSCFLDSKVLKRDMFLLGDRTIERVEPVWSKFYRKDFLLRKNLKFNEKLRRSEDVIFNYEAYTQAESIYHLNEFGYIYRATNNSVTRSFDPIMDTTTFKLIEEFELLFKKLNIVDENYPHYVFRLMVRLIRKYYVHLSEEEYNSKIDLLFSNVIVDDYLGKIDLSNYDIYKKQLHKLLVIKDKGDLYNYLRNVCDKKLLKK